MEEGSTESLAAARTARMTQNEALFRDVNEQIAALNDLGEQLDRFAVVCECGHATCGDVVSVHKSVYEAVRAQADTFIVVNGHVIAEIERIVEQHGTFVVVDKKDGIPEEVAKATDPRA